MTSPPSVYITDTAPVCVSRPIIFTFIHQKAGSDKIQTWNIKSERTKNQTQNIVQKVHKVLQI